VRAHSRSIIPVLFINVHRLLTTNIHLVYGWGGIAIAAALLAVFVVQFCRELRSFGLLKIRQGRQKEANDVLFYSFVGSIIYGHGEMRNVSARLAALVTILAETLFLVVCAKLLLVLTCVTPSVAIPNFTGSVLLLNESVVCWEGDHRALGCCAMIAFGFYLPLAAMIAPLMTESPPAETPTAEDPMAAAAAAEDAQMGRSSSVGSGAEKTKQVRLGKKDISFAKPFLAVITGTLIMRSTVFE